MAYSFGDEKIDVVEDGESNKMESAELGYKMEGEDKTFYFILNKGISLSTITFSIEYSTGNVNYVAEKKGLGSEALAGGSRYNFNLSISDGALNISEGAIVDWGTGTQMDDIIINTPTQGEDANNEDA